MFPRIFKKFYNCIVKLFIFLNSILWYFLYCNYSVCSYEFMVVSSVIIFRLSYMVKKKVKCVEISACSTILHIPDVYILQISDSFWELCPLVFQFYPYLDLIIVLLNLQLYLVEMVSLAAIFINISSQISSIRQTL